MDITRFKMIAAVAIAAIAGAASAVLLTADRALAWDYGNLPAGCSQAGTIYDSSGPSYTYTIECGSATTSILYGASPYPSAPTNPNFQSDLDAFVDANYTPPATSTSTPASTDATTSTSASTTTGSESPATTTGTTTTSGAASTTTDAAPTTTSVLPTTAAAAAGPTVDELQAQLDELKAQLAALNTRVGKLEQASVDAWSAFQGAIETGATPDAAALTARSVAMNDLYGLTS